MRGSYLLLAFAVVVADISSKNWAAAVLQHEQAMVLSPYLRFLYVENTGVAFGVFAGGGDIVRWLLVALTGMISIVLLGFLWHASSKLEMTAVALMIGGAIGNFYDRVFYGYVIDFIDAHWHGYHWPAFNVADIAVSIGAFLFFCTLMKGASK